MREFDKQMNRAFKQLALKPGDIYESCSYHPVLCLGVDYKHDEIWGISLIDGKHPMSCSLVHCGVRKLTPKQVWAIKVNGPSGPDAGKRISQKKRWWNTSTQNTPGNVGLTGPRKERSPSLACTAAREKARR
jgi:hypothetical protein